MKTRTILKAMLLICFSILRIAGTLNHTANAEALDLGSLNQKERKEKQSGGELNDIEGTIIGTVENSDGESLDGVIITISSVNTNFKKERYNNKNGTFKFTGLKVGKYTIRAFMPGRIKEYKNWGPETVSLSVACVLERDITMEKNGFEVVFKDQFGNGVPGVKANLNWNAHGSHEVKETHPKYSNDRGVVLIDFRKWNFSHFKYFIDFHKDRDFHVLGDQSRFISRNDTEKGNISIEIENKKGVPGGKAAISGVVYKINKGEKIFLSGSKIKINGSQIDTDTDGNYSIDVDVPSGKTIFQVTAVADGTGYMPEKRKMTLASGYMFKADFELKNRYPGVSGYLVSKNILSNRLRLLNKKKYDITIKNCNTNFEIINPLSLGGDFKFEAVPPGSYILESNACVSNNPEPVISGLNLTLNTNVSLNFVEETNGKGQKNGEIRGTVKARILNEIILAGINVTLESMGKLHKDRTLSADSCGVYRFKDLPPGTYKISFELDGFRTLSQTIDVMGSHISKIDTTLTQKDNKLLASLNNNITTEPIGDTSSLKPGLGWIDVFDIEDFSLEGTEFMSMSFDGASAGLDLNTAGDPFRNKFSTSSFFYYESEQLQSQNTRGTDLYNAGTGSREQTGYKLRMYPGITISGPIIKDKFWFFGKFNMEQENKYIPGFPHDGKDIPVIVTRVYPSGKLTYKPTRNDKIALTYNYSHNSWDNFRASRYYNDDTSVKRKIPRHQLLAHLEKTFGSNLLSGLKVAFVSSNEKLESKQPGSQYSNWLSGLQTGSYWENSNGIKQNRLQVNADVTAVIDNLAGSHEIKISGEIQRNNISRDMVTNVSDPSAMNIIYMYPEFVGGNGLYYGYHLNSFHRKEEMLYNSLTLTDVWNITNKLTLTLNVSYEYRGLIWPRQAIDTSPAWDPFLEEFINRSIAGKITALKWENLSPRVGLIYDVFSDGTTLVKASYGHFVLPNQMAFVNAAHPNGWHYWRKLYLGNETPVAYRSGAAPGRTKIGYDNKNLRAPTANELSVGLEKGMWENWSLEVRYVKRWEKNHIFTVDAAALDIDSLMENGKLIWTDWEPVTIVDPYDGRTLTFWNNLDPGRVPEEYIVNPPDVDREFDGIEVTLNKRYSKRWSLHASYSYANSRGLIPAAKAGLNLEPSRLFADPNAHVNAFGRLSRERRHRLRVLGYFDGPWGINITGRLHIMSGHRWTRTVSSDHLGVPLNQTAVSIYAEKRGASGYPTQTLLDLTLLKRFKISNALIELYVEIFNVFNSNTVSQEFTNSSNPVLLFGKDENIVDPRMIRLGFKFIL